MVFNTAGRKKNSGKLGRATADEVAEQTKRARAVESAYLNQLVLMGYLKKERVGRKAYFYVEREGEKQ